jgi:Ca2+-dependent lipid-binding protein
MGEDLGRAYLQMQFLLEGQEKTVAGTRLPDTVAELKHDFGRVVGTVLVKIVSASQLYSADLTGKSDPFVEAYLSTDESSKRMKTKVMPDTLDPVWNFEGSLYVQLLRCQVKGATVTFDVRDEDPVGSDFLGSVDVELIDILEKNPNSEMVIDCPLKNPEKKGSPNLG